MKHHSGVVVLFTLLKKRTGTGHGREYSVGPHRILLPRKHRLDEFQQRWKRYDVALGEIARELFAKYPGGTAIDIGANIGDSAALICKHQNVPVLCIEGSREFLPFLRENAARVGPHVELETSFVADDFKHVDPKKIRTRHGSSSIVDAVGADSNTDALPTKSLAAILGQHPRFDRSKLLKIDTDGFDFFIIRNALSFIEAVRPVVFFEYYLEGSHEAAQQGLAAVESLGAVGYCKYLVYDNFGNFLISVDTPTKFAELSAYLISNQNNGTAIYYFDVCSFHREDEDLFDLLRHRELMEADRR